jgi:hypothetical protein
VALFPLNIVVELLLNGSWIDVSKFVYQRDTITITGGSTAAGDTPSPATATMTFNNRDGRFSPNYAGGAYYPYLVRNTQLRISVNDTSSSGNVYNGFRFWGEVPDWPPLNDLSGHDVYVPITASGPLRRIGQGGGEGSALQRYFATLTGGFAPVAYWPCEEEADAGVIGAGVQGGSNMTVVSGTPKFKAVSDFNGSSPIGVLNGSTWTGVTSSFGSSGDDLFIAAGTYQWVASTTTVNAKVIGGGGGGTKGSEGNGGGTAGGGGAFAQNTALAVTPGQAYTVTVGAGGSPGNWNIGGSPGNASSIAGDAATVTGNPGQGGGANGVSGGLGGTSSGAPVNHPGGAGGAVPGTATGGGGGGGSGGSGATGNAGANSSGGSGGAGGAAVTGGGKGGNGGGNAPSDGQPGGDPGGGGGGGWANNVNHTYGGAGAPGSVELVYTSSGGGTQPNNNVIRFIMFVPKHTGNDGKVLVRALTSSTTVARLDVQYRKGGNIRLLGYNSGASLVFDSGNLAVGADGQTLMVSAELAKSGTAVAWAFSAIIPGASGVVAKTSGSVAASSMGSVSQIVVAPASDITKTAIGHISVQYALIPLWKVSEALDGHHTEAGIDRFIRLAGEQAMGAVAEYNEGADHWGFEPGTQSWTGTNCAVTQSSVTHFTSGVQDWPTDGTHSLLLTATGGAGQWSASSPTGTSGQPVIAGDVVSAHADVYTPAALGAVGINVSWYNAAGTFLSATSGAPRATAAGDVVTVRIGAADGCIAPATAAFFSVQVADNETKTAGTLMYTDNVRVNPQMGPQATKQYKSFLTEIRDLDQGIMKEAKTLWGLGYRTRIRLINQSPVVTLDYAQGMLSPPLAPVVQVLNLKNDITVKRKKGSKVQVTLSNGQMSILEPPQGTGRYKKNLTAVAAADEQLAALAAHLLTVGTVSDEAYPSITVNLARAGIAGNPLAPLMSAVAGAEVGDVIQLNNLPLWFPSTTTKQLVLGYTETLNAFEWTVTWNCQPYSPYVQVTTNIRRW